MSKEEKEFQNTKIEVNKKSSIWTIVSISLGAIAVGLAAVAFKTALDNRIPDISNDEWGDIGC